MEYDLTAEEGVYALLRTSQSSQDWNNNCDRIKKANEGGYPNFWFATVISSGLCDEIASRWGGSSKMSVLAS